MKPIKSDTYADRQAASNDAKQALLARFKPKPMIKAAEPLDRAADKAAQLAAVRAARTEAKLAAREAAESAAEADRMARNAAIKERKALTSSEQKERRDARYAARKARQR